MVRPQHFESLASPRTVAGLVSVLLHIGVLVLIVMSGGRWDGLHEVATPAMQFMWMDEHVADRPEGAEPEALTQARPELVLGEQPDVRHIEPSSVPRPELDIRQAEADEELPAVANVDVNDADEIAAISVIDTLSTFVMPQVQAEELLERVERLAEELASTPRAQASWQQDGRQYDAQLVLEPARSGVELERAIVEISAEHQGRQLRTRISLKRLPFSHFAQVIDRWDPMVQLHDDEIVGRVHINSRFNVLVDSQAAPKLLGKVTTAAGGVNLERSGRRRDSDVFSAGIETGARRIPFSEQGWSFEQARHDANVRVHELAGDTDIRFLGEGGYWWRDQKSGSWQQVNQPDGRSVYFMAPRGATVYLRGVVSGKFLVYSPHLIVVEGNITYARDPRGDPASGDFLGLVCDKDIEVAPSRVTGPGDLHIHAALFAKRRIAVMDVDHHRSATMHIFGSLAAGTLLESEPRYATKVEYDWRFERLRPPGFPSMNRFATEDWDRAWTEVPDGRLSGAGLDQVQQ